jgi:DNA-binding transcriptional LysR family regulator
MSQPAVSAAIKAMEVEYGLPLFSRAGGHVELTGAGQILLGYVKQIKVLEEQALREMRNFKESVSGRLVVGASTTIAQYILPRLLGEFASNFPQVQFVLIAQITEQMAELLRSSELDVAIVEGSIKGNEFNTRVWLKDELRLHVPPGHPSIGKIMTFKELCSIPLLMREKGSGTHQIQQERFRNRKVEFDDLNIVLELGSTESIKLAIESGLGCGFLSDWSCVKEHHLGTLVPVQIENFSIVRNFSIVQTKEAENNPLIQRFVNFVSGRATIRPPTDL